MNEPVEVSAGAQLAKGEGRGSESRRPLSSTDYDPERRSSPIGTTTVVDWDLPLRFDPDGLSLERLRIGGRACVVFSWWPQLPLPSLPRPL